MFENNKAQDTQFELTDAEWVGLALVVRGHVNTYPHTRLLFSIRFVLRVCLSASHGSNRVEREQSW